MRSHLVALTLALLSFAVQAQPVEVDEEPPAAAAETGKAKASGYFQDRKKAAPAAAQEAPPAGPPRYMAVRLGGFFTDQAYSWGRRGDQNNIGGFNAGVDYRLGEWVNTADLGLRIDYTSYRLTEDSARKLSFGGTVTFPDVASGFPLYFGAGLGLGFFVKQLRDESALALDYSLFGGVRFLNVIEKVGFSFETGIKNHLHLFSDGQFNGIFANVGAVFNF